MLIKVISTRTVYGDKAKVLKRVMENEKTEHFLYRIFGTIEGHQLGKGKHKRVDKETGEAVDTYWTKFFGDFMAKNSDGETFEAATCFLPDYVSGQFVSKLSGETDITNIDIAFDVFAVYSAQAATSYEYIAKPVRTTDEPSRVETMAERMLGTMPDAKALPKPKK